MSTNRFDGAGERTISGGADARLRWLFRRYSVSSPQFERHAYSASDYEGSSAATWFVAGHRVGPNHMPD